MELAGQGPSCPLPGSAQGQAAAEAGGGPRRKWLKFAARAGNGLIVEEELECQLECRPLGAAPPPPAPPAGDLGPEAGSDWCLGQRSSCPLGWVPSPCPLRFLARGHLGGGLGIDGGAAGWWRGRELNQVLPLPLAGAPSQLPPPGASAPPTSLAPVHLALSTLWHQSHFRTHSSPPGRLLPSGELLSSLQDPALAAAPRSSCADSPQPADAAPPLPALLQSHSPDPLYRGRPCVLLCLPHGTVAPPRRSTRWSTQLAPSVCWAWKRSPCGFSCLRDGLGIRSEFSLSWAAGAAWT